MIAVSGLPAYFETGMKGIYPLQRKDLSFPPIPFQKHVVINFLDFVE